MGELPAIGLADLSWDEAKALARAANLMVELQHHLHQDGCEHIGSLERAAMKLETAIMVAGDLEP